MLMKERLCTNGTLSRCTYSVLLLVALMSMAFSSTVLAQGQHGISFVKGCNPSVGLEVGDPVSCSWTIKNTDDTGNGGLNAAVNANNWRK